MTYPYIFPRAVKARDPPMSVDWTAPLRHVMAETFGCNLIEHASDMKSSHEYGMSVNRPPTEAHDSIGTKYMADRHDSVLSEVLYSLNV